MALFWLPPSIKCVLTKLQMEITLLFSNLKTVNPAAKKKNHMKKFTRIGQKNFRWKSHYCSRNCSNIQSARKISNVLSLENKEITKIRSITKKGKS
jgi:hypothetical protein